MVRAKDRTYIDNNHGHVYIRLSIASVDTQFMCDQHFIISVAFPFTLHPAHGGERLQLTPQRVAESLPACPPHDPGDT